MKFLLTGPKCQSVLTDLSRLTGAGLKALAN